MINGMEHAMTRRLRRNLRRTIGSLCIAAMWTVGLSAATFSEVRNVSLFADIKAHKVGDLLTVHILESATARNAVGSNVKKSNTFELDAGPGIGKLDFIGLFGLNTSSENKSTNQGQTSRAGQLRAQMTVQVVGIRDNGDLVIQGTRVIGINNDKEQLLLTGIVRADDVKPDNSISSHQIADAQISYRGKGAASSGGKSGFVSRVLNWLF